MSNENDDCPIALRTRKRTKKAQNDQGNDTPMPENEKQHSRRGSRRQTQKRDCDKEKGDARKGTQSRKRKLETCGTESSSKQLKKKKDDNVNRKTVVDKEEYTTVIVKLTRPGVAVEKVDKCTICLGIIEDRKTLDVCKHSFCRSCIDNSFKKINPICPLCGFIYGKLTGNQPKDGTMKTRINTKFDLEGYENCGVIIIKYFFPDGVQTEEHPNPGEAYSGTYRKAFLPNNQEGQHVCELLRQAFNARLTFTVGRSATTGFENQVIWNDIHHKTCPNGGKFRFGYPDDTYLARVKFELAPPFSL